MHCSHRLGVTRRLISSLHPKQSDAQHACIHGQEAPMPRLTACLRACWHTMQAAAAVADPHHGHPRVPCKRPVSPRAQVSTHHHTAPTRQCLPGRSGCGAQPCTLQQGAHGMTGWCTPDALALARPPFFHVGLHVHRSCLGTLPQHQCVQACALWPLPAPLPPHRLLQRNASLHPPCRASADKPGRLHVNTALWVPGMA
jgi:hypothetical protein